jgi:hypothetical protein
MRTIRWAALALCVSVAGACERDERTARQEVSTAAREDPGFATDEPVRVIPVPDTAGGRTLTGNLVEMNNSGATGVVTVTPVNGQTLIQLSLTGVQPNTQVIPTVHLGGCDEVGQRVEQLEAFTVEPTGAALANITLDRVVETIADGRHSVRIYPEQGQMAPPIACAELPTTAAETRM